MPLLFDVDGVILSYCASEFKCLTIWYGSCRVRGLGSRGGLDTHRAEILKIQFRSVDKAISLYRIFVLLSFTLATAANPDSSGVRRH
ncbi:hypothetical protein MKW98_007378 [Papaver atlanticum]|uniref:Uncharacterized protein n=1 Tax=Papaver atlanticum TaxID=357466 RepID=A0AAD4SBL7_9MAGN|nr:hypothetical protein MKW98_007378 [Papaver atlanticum]